MSFCRLFSIFFAVVAPSAALAQGSWDYLELLHSSSSEAKFTRWGEVESDGCWGENAAPTPAGQECLSLKLPKGLVGDAEVELVLRGTVGARGEFYNLRGDNAEAVCVKAEAGYSCFIRVLPAVAVDAQKVDDYLTHTITDPTKLATAKYRAGEFRRDRVLRFWWGID